MQSLSDILTLRGGLIGRVTIRSGSRLPVAGAFEGGRVAEPVRRVAGGGRYADPVLTALRQERPYGGRAEESVEVSGYLGSLPASG